jgi:hypothetical protein
MTTSKPISRGEFASMPRVTPTGLAEAVYQGARSRPMPSGPSGIAIPYPRATYRPTIDVPLLRRICSAATSARVSAALPDERRAAVAAALLEVLRQRYPQDDMQVLKRWGLAWDHRNIGIRYTRHSHIFVELPEPCLMPKGGAPTFVSEVAHPDSEVQIPADADEYFRALHEINELGVRAGGAHAWAARFRKAEGRHPRWQEIEAAWPLIGEWLADQRRQMKEPHHGR